MVLCSWTKKSGSNLSGKAHGLNDEFTATGKNNYTTPSILGTYSLNNEEMDKIGGRARKEVALKFKNENNLKGNDISLNNYDVQRNYGSRAQEIKIEREDRRNSYNKTRPGGEKVYSIGFPYNNSFPRLEITK